MKKNNKKYSRISKFQLLTIFRMQSEGKKVRAIGREIKRSAGTISKLLNNYAHPDWGTWDAMSWMERAQLVHEQMEANKVRKWHGVCVRDAEIAKHITARLEAKDTPEIISAKIGARLKGKSVSVKTIYNFIKQRRGLKKHLIEKGKKRRQNVHNIDRRWKKKAAPKKRSHKERCREANERLEVGHLEGDLVVSGKKGKSAILSLIDRKTRKRTFIRLPNKEAKTALAYLRALLASQAPGFIKSITFDNGGEFSYTELIKLESVYNILIYYCDPCCPWQKGSVENSNRLFRRYFPKGTNFDSVSKAEIRLAEQTLNNRPMKCLGFISSLEVEAQLLHEQMAKAA